jgi:hypothetical protein
VPSTSWTAPSGTSGTSFTITSRITEPQRSRCLLLLERLSPTEQAVFLRHDVSDGAVRAVRSVINPDKLHHMGPLSDFRSHLRAGRGGSGG